MQSTLFRQTDKMQGNFWYAGSQRAVPADCQPEGLEEERVYIHSIECTKKVIQIDTQLKQIPIAMQYLQVSKMPLKFHPPMQNTCVD